MTMPEIDVLDPEGIEVQLRFWEEERMIYPGWKVTAKEGEGWVAEFTMHRSCDYRLTPNEFDVFARGVVEGRVWMRTRGWVYSEQPVKLTWLHCVALLADGDPAVRMRALSGLQELVQNHPARIPATRTILAAIVDEWPEGEPRRAAAGLLEEL